MRFKTLTVIIIFILTAVAASGDEPPRIRKSEFKKHSFTAGELRITFTRFWPGSLLSRGYIEVKVENTSTAAATFDPLRLSFVNKDNKQVNVQAVIQHGRYSRPGYGINVVEREVAPNAYIKEFYWLDGRLHFPAQFFYEGKRLALITE
jgi:hypothetical protein